MKPENDKLVGELGSLIRKMVTDMGHTNLMPLQYLGDGEVTIPFVRNKALVRLTIFLSPVEILIETNGNLTYANAEAHHALYGDVLKIAKACEQHIKNFA